MTITAKILADSVHTDYGDAPSRITTFELRYPRFIHAEFMTHRLFSRNSASARAIPIEKMIADVQNDPAMFVFWGRNQKGMQALEEMTSAERDNAWHSWLAARNSAVIHAHRLLGLGLHKQNVNRLLEPWMHITVIATATDFANFYHLRRDPMAQPEMQALAEAMWTAHGASQPVDRTNVDHPRQRWHLPLVTDEERVEFGHDAIKVCVGRCARVSYLTHDGKRDPAADIELHDRLMRSGHWSPFEHAALCNGTRRSGNFVGWEQYRKLLPGEHPYKPGQVKP